MDVFYYYNYGTAAWLGLQAAPLIISPHIITTMLSPEIRETTGKPRYEHRIQLRLTFSAFDSPGGVFLPHARVLAHRPRRPHHTSDRLGPADFHLCRM